MMLRGEQPAPPIARLLGFDLTSGDPVAEGGLVKPARTVGLVECTIIDGSDRLVARAFSTCMILRGAAARRRPHRCLATPLRGSPAFASRSTASR